MSRRSPGLLVALALCSATLFGGLSSCRGGHFARPPEPEAEPEYRRLRKQDPKTGTVVRSWTVLVYADGHSVKHGKDERWYSNGARLSEASFRYGEPMGELKRWYANGQLRSESSYGPRGELTPMRFWHENGQLSAEGTARHGRREGYWRFWFTDGAPRERGGYVDGERSGLWTLYWEDGSVQSTGRFEAGERVGPWDHHEPGQSFDEEPARPTVKEEAEHSNPFDDLGPELED